MSRTARHGDGEHWNKAAIQGGTEHRWSTARHGDRE